MENSREHFHKALTKKIFHCSKSIEKDCNYLETVHWGVGGVSGLNIYNLSIPTACLIWKIYYSLE